jgi:hypothetical protein
MIGVCKLHSGRVGENNPRAYIILDTRNNKIELWKYGEDDAGVIKGICIIVGPN